MMPILLAVLLGAVPADLVPPSPPPAAASGASGSIDPAAATRAYLAQVPAEQRAPILKAYLQHAPGARPHVPVSKDARLGEFQKVAPAFPVFRVVSNVHAHPRA